ncbi:membrane protein [Mycobacterium antarcticum]|uniref:MmpS family transport accessory protein n=1 Tax=Mycolicibacterium sp. TUM20983 TaxID=3023369 RepID=UPI0023A3B3CC|nr:MmpS family transport accessory protein [Mycolicibacterium sp. TUM20983]GLP74542.1 membrane protein [Mycolicibacterium sp. TUM20983]
MTDPSRPDRWGQEHPGTYHYPAYPGSPYGQQPPYEAPKATEQLPAYSPYGYDSSATGHYGPPNLPGGAPPEPPRPGGPRRWLWVLAGTALVIVLGLVVGLVVVNSSQQNTLVAPPQTPLEPTAAAPSTTTRTPTTTRVPTSAPTTTPGVIPPTDSVDPSGTHTVVYSVAGEGRAISILYLDTGGVLQTEFNVVLPWTKEVELAGAANSSASVSIVNVGHELTCSITIDGTETQQTTGTGLTLCTSLGSR